jgi:hypothetical protein
LQAGPLFRHPSNTCQLISMGVVLAPVSLSEKPLTTPRGLRCVGELGIRLRLPVDQMPDHEELCSLVIRMALFPPDCSSKGKLSEPLRSLGLCSTTYRQLISRTNQVQHRCFPLPDLLPAHPPEIGGRRKTDWLKKSSWVWRRQQT